MVKRLPFTRQPTHAGHLPLTYAEPSFGPWPAKFGIAMNRPSEQKDELEKRLVFDQPKVGAAGGA